MPHDSEFMSVVTLAQQLQEEIGRLKKQRTTQRDEMPQDVAVLIRRVEELEEDVAKWKQAATLERQSVDHADAACCTLRADNATLRERAERLERERDEAQEQFAKTWAQAESYRNQRDWAGRALLAAQLRIKQLEALRVV